jgi:hypothetical protein
MKLKKIVLTLFFQFFLWGSGRLLAHPMPNSMVLLNVHDKHISGEIQLPLSELQSAIGNNVDDNSEKLIERLGEFLKNYLKDHIKPKSLDGTPWSIELGELKLIETKSKLSGDYKELVVVFSMAPPLNYDLRNFYFDYDAILHNVASHKAIIAIKQDWQQGIVHEDITIQEVGIIEWDVVSNQLKPFQVNLDEGSILKGFKSMFFLGSIHISEGTDHLLFLLVLLTPIPLEVSNNKWAKTKKLKSALIQIFKIVTAFTIGHSITLLVGSYGLNIFPSKFIEILIGISILVSAIHAFKPTFAGKEIYIALSFGFVHGLTFANSISDLHLNYFKLLISVIGFNLGIEFMQIVIIVAVIPWLLLLSKSNYYPFFRVLVAIFAGIAAMGWVWEFLMEKPNLVTEIIQKFVDFYYHIYSLLILISSFLYFLNRLNPKVGLLRK